MPGFVLGADGPQHDGAVAPGHGLHQLHRVGPDCKGRTAPGRPGTDADARVQRQHAGGVGKQGVDVQLGDLRHRFQQRRHAAQRGHDGIHVGCRHVAPTRQQARHAGAGHQRAGQRRVQRRQRHGAVGHHLHGRAALAEQDHRAEQRVDMSADDQFQRPRPAHHALHGEAGDLGTGLVQHHARQHGRGSSAQAGVVLDVQGHAADVALVRDLWRQDLQRHRVAQAARRRHGFMCRRRCHQRGDDGDAAGLQHGLGLGLGQPFAPGGQHSGHHVAHLLQVGHRRRASGRWGFEQQRLVVTVVAQHGERPHGFFGRVVAGDAGVLKRRARGAHRRVTHPAGQQALQLGGFGLYQGQQGAGDVGAGHDGGGGVHEQHRARGGVVQQRFQCRHITCCRRVTDDVHRVGARPSRRQHRVQRLQRGGRQDRQLDTRLRCRIGRQHTSAAAVGDEREVVHRRELLVAQAAQRGRAHACQRDGGGEQVLQGVHAQHAGAADGGVEDDVAAGQRPGVRGGGLLPVQRAPGLDDDDRLVACRGARCRHELARRLNAFDVEQDGLGAGVAAEVVEQVAEIDIGMLAQRDHLRKAHPARLRPVQHGRGQRARLRHEGQRARRRRQLREAGVQPVVWRQQPQAVRPQDAQHMLARSGQHGLLLRRGQPRGHDDGGPRAARAQLAYQRGHAGRRGADQRQLGCLRQRRHAVPGLHAVHRGVLAVDSVQRTLEAALAQVAPHGGADAAGAVGSADDRHRSGLQQAVEVADAHGGFSGGAAVRFAPGAWAWPQTNRSV